MGQNSALKFNFFNLILCFSHNSPFENLLKNKIASNDFESKSYAFKSTNEVLTILASGEPLAIDIPLNEEGVNDNGDFQYTEENRRQCLSHEVKCGFHAVVLTGYDIEKKVFYFKNSWGTSWGVEGYGTIAFDVIDRHSDPYISTVQLKNEIILPKDYNVKNTLNISEIKFTSEKNAEGKAIFKTTGKIKNLGQSIVSVAITLVKQTIPNPVMDKDFKTIYFNDQEASLFPTDYVGVEEYIFPDHENADIDWTEQSPNTQSFSDIIMNSATVIDVFNENTQLFYRTSLYLMTDEGSSRLKRIYTPVQK